MLNSIIPPSHHPNIPTSPSPKEKKRDVEERLRLAETYGDPELLAQVREEVGDVPSLEEKYGPMAPQVGYCWSTS